MASAAVSTKLNVLELARRDTKERERVALEDLQRAQEAAQDALEEADHELRRARKPFKAETEALKEQMAPLEHTLTRIQEVERDRAMALLALSDASKLAAVFANKRHMRVWRHPVKHTSGVTYTASTSPGADLAEYRVYDPQRAWEVATSEVLSVDEKRAALAEVFDAFLQ